MEKEDGLVEVELYLQYTSVLFIDSQRPVNGKVHPQPDGHLMIIE